MKMSMLAARDGDVDMHVMPTAGGHRRNGEVLFSRGYLLPHGGEATSFFIFTDDNVAGEYQWSGGNRADRGTRSTNSAQIRQ